MQSQVTRRSDQRPANSSLPLLPLLLRDNPPTQPTILGFDICHPLNRLVCLSLGTRRLYNQATSRPYSGPQPCPRSVSNAGSDTFRTSTPASAHCLRHPKNPKRQINVSVGHLLAASKSSASRSATMVCYFWHFLALYWILDLPFLFFHAQRPVPISLFFLLFYT